MALLSKTFKTLKSDKANKGYATRIMHLAPHRMVSQETLCSASTHGCKEVCLYCSGWGKRKHIDAARRRRTAFMVREPLAFFCQLIKEIAAFERYATRRSLKPAVRLNGTSDIAWEDWRLKDQTLMSLFPNVTFYDYTKVLLRMQMFLAQQLPPNYHLTFSQSEDNGAACDDVLTFGGQVAVVFRRKPFPKSWRGYQVFDGDEDDLRFIKPRRARVIALEAKGKAKVSSTPFVEEN